MSLRPQVYGRMVYCHRVNGFAIVYHDNVFRPIHLLNSYVSIGILKDGQTCYIAIFHFVNLELGHRNRGSGFGIIRKHSLRERITCFA